MDEKKIEEVLTRLLEGPVGDALCAKIVAQVGHDMPRVMEPYLTKTEYNTEGKKAAAEFAEGMQDSSKQVAEFFENVAGREIRLHNLEALQAVDHYSTLNPKEGLDLKMALMTRIRERVLQDLDGWVVNESIGTTPKLMMYRLIKFLRPEKGSMN